MKRVVLSDSQLEQVLSLRQNGLSWVKIQRETGIPRRIARRDYEESQRRQSQRQLESARKDIAAQEYRLHLDLLAHFAGNLVDAVGMPEMITELMGADKVMANLFSKDIYKEHQPIGLSVGEWQREKRIVSMNLLLFKSLRDHTRGKARWEALDEWKAARDRCVGQVEMVRRELITDLDNILAQKPQLKKMLDASNRPDLSSRVVEGTLVNIWLNDVIGKEGTVTSFLGASAIKKDTAWIKFHEQAPGWTIITFDSNDRSTNKDFAKEIAGMSNRAILNLRTKGALSEIKLQTDKMQKAANELETTLNPLVLRPIILNTRCDICPI